jgi:glycogen(starch) synthase
VFIWVPCGVKGKRHDVADSLALFDDLREAVQEESKKMSKRMLDAFSQRKPIRQSQLIDDRFLQYLKRTSLKFRKKSQNPPVSPFVTDPNEITRSLERNNLMNGREDKVKVIYYPTYISSTDGIMGLDYYNAMMACHVGVLPSYYEPWGYTPLEAAALGCQSITTDLAGYGKFMKPKVNKGDYSIMVLARENRTYEQGVSDLESMLFSIYMMDKRQRGQYKIKAKELSVLADWSSMIKNYMKAYDMALKK